MSIATKDVLKLLDATPKLRPLVMRWARQAARGEKLPTTFSAADLGYEDQQSLERFLRVTTSRTRSGALRRQLVLILSAISGVSADDERSVLAEAGIEENPYTSSVVVSAPFTFRLKDGTYFDYPMKFFMKRLVCRLSRRHGCHHGDAPGWRTKGKASPRNRWYAVCGSAPGCSCGGRTFLSRP